MTLAGAPAVRLRTHWPSGKAAHTGGLHAQLVAACRGVPLVVPARAQKQMLRCRSGALCRYFSGAPCTRVRRRPPAAVCRVLEQAGVVENCHDASPAQFCAAFLARMVDTALSAHERDMEATTGKGLLLNYASMPDAALPPLPGGDGRARTPCECCAAACP